MATTPTPPPAPEDEHWLATAHLCATLQAALMEAPDDDLKGLLGALRTTGQRALDRGRLGSVQVVEAAVALVLHEVERRTPGSVTVDLVAALEASADEELRKLKEGD